MQLDPQLESQKKKMQVELIMKDSDQKKIVREKVACEVAIRDLKHKLAQTQLDLASKENELKQLQTKDTEIQNEMIKLKHQINTLGQHNF